MPTSTQSRRFRILDLDTNQSTDLEQATTLRPVTLLPVPYISQLGIGADAHRNDCGAASVIMLLRAYLGTVMTPDEFYTRCTIRSYAEHLGISADRLIAGNGTTQFIYSIPAVLNVKKALIVGPTYSDYEDACRLQGAASEYFLCTESDDFRPAMDYLEKATAGADAVFICNPPYWDAHPGNRIETALPTQSTGAFHLGRVLSPLRRRR